MRRSLQINPDNQPASWERIEYWRDFHEISPIETTLGWFHADPHSIENRMKGSIERFESLPILNPDNTLTWKQPGQLYIPLTKTQLQQVYDEIKLNAAIRSSLLHVKGEQFRMQTPRPSENQLRHIAFWLPPETP